jgi:5-amino-6-(5-phosphoribosylamino)uracil reductase
VPARPFVLLSVAMSLDGYIDDGAPAPLLLSDAADLDRVDDVRAGVDAILVGASTVRRDNPRLLVRSPQRRAARAAAGLAPDPAKVTLSATGDLDPGARFFATGASAKIVYVPSSLVVAVQERLGGVATVVGAGEPLDVHALLADLAGRGVRRLMVEGGTGVHTLFLTAGIVDEIHVVVAPFFVGDATAPRFVGPGAFPHDAAHRMRLAEARPIGDVVLLRYLTTSGTTDA